MVGSLQSALIALRKCVRLAAQDLGAHESSAAPDPQSETNEKKVFCQILLLAAERSLAARQKSHLLHYQPEAEQKVAAGECPKRHIDKLQFLYNLVAAALGPKLGTALSFNGGGTSEEALVQASARFDVLDLEVDEFDHCLIGYVYQFLQEPTRKLCLKRTQSANKSCSTTDIIGFTQIYTPAWVADYLIQRALQTQLPAQDLRLLDPACGAGNFLNRTLFLLCQRRRNECPTEAPDVVAAELLTKNIFGCDIDSVALWAAGLSLAVQYLSLCEQMPPGGLPQLNLTLVSSEKAVDIDLGTLSRDWPPNHILSQKFDAIVGNPPYVGRKLLDRRLKSLLKNNYQNAHQDLCTAFIARGLELLKPGGRLAYITQSSLLYLPTYAKFRSDLLREFSFIHVIEAGTQVFPLQTGEKINSIMLVLERSAPGDKHLIDYLDLRQSTAKRDDLLCEYSNTSNSETGAPTHLQSSFAFQHRSALNFNCPPAFQDICKLSAKLGDIAEIKQGLATSDNERFLKHWTAVPPEDIGKRWVPYIKGSGCERWFAPIETVVDWGDDGADIKAAVAIAYPYLKGKTAWVVKNEKYYGMEGLTFSFVNSKEFAVRHLPPGCIFDVAGSAVFPHAQEQRLFLLAYLNSSFINAAAGWLNPTINFQVGDLKLLPILEFSAEEQSLMSHLAALCVQLKRTLASFSRNGYDLPPYREHLLSLNVELSNDAHCGAAQASTIFDSLHQLCEQLLVLELKIDRIVLSALARSGLAPESVSQIEIICQNKVMKRKRAIAPFSTVDELFEWLKVQDCKSTSNTLQASKPANSLV
jgi:hypothetical protein